MSTVLQFRTSNRTEPRKLVSGAAGEIVIFPGVRIERDGAAPDVDLGHRTQDSARRGDFDGIDGGRRPRRTS